MSMFDGMNNPDIPVGDVRLYYSEGCYRVRIDHCKAVEAKDSFKGVASFIAETICIASNNPNVRPGSTRCWVQKFERKNVDRAFATVKAFLVYAMGLTPENADAAIIQSGFVTPTNEADWTRFTTFATSEANPLRGLELDLMCVTKDYTDKETGGKSQFTVHDWRPKGSIQLQ